MSAGYSGKPLFEKLGIREGHKVAALNAPADYKSLVGRMPAGVTVSHELAGKFDLVHLFVVDEMNLQKQLKMSIGRIKPSGMIWVSWPKGKSRLRSRFGENAVRNIGLKNGLVDVKICAVDGTWSGLKFVRRLKDRR